MGAFRCAIGDSEQCFKNAHPQGVSKLI
jgi:hypothetical protein